MAFRVARLEVRMAFRVGLNLLRRLPGARLPGAKIAKVARSSLGLSSLSKPRRLEVRYPFQHRLKFARLEVRCPSAAAEARKEPSKSQL